MYYFVCQNHLHFFFLCVKRNMSAFLDHCLSTKRYGYCPTVCFLSVLNGQSFLALPVSLFSFRTFMSGACQREYLLCSNNSNILFSSSKYPQQLKTLTKTTSTQFPDPPPFPSGIHPYEQKQSRQEEVLRERAMICLFVINFLGISEITIFTTDSRELF